MTRPDPRHKRLGTRASKLALTQSSLVREALLRLHPNLDIRIETISTMGDRIQDRSLIELGGKGLFVKEIEEALLKGTIDLAVHSFKDMPALLPPGLTIGAVMEREDARDALIAPGYGTLQALPPGAVLGTASPRRQAQTLMLRRDLRVQPLRGNVDTRLRKIDEGQAQATILAIAGLKRLGLADRADHIFTIEEMLPAVAQGAICVECRADDASMLSLLASIDHGPSRIAVTAERACLRVLEGSCRTPIAGYATVRGDKVYLQAMIATPDGSSHYRVQEEASATDADALGEELGRQLRALGGADFFAS